MLAISTAACATDDASPKAGASGGQHAGSAAAGRGVTATAGIDAEALPCTNAEWTQNCGTKCSFDAASIDCTTACRNLTAVCEAGCPSCMGMNLDQPSCMTGCATYKRITCFNRLLGCFTSNDTCDSVTMCANARP
jgi:hypothetical protein